MADKNIFCNAPWFELQIYWDGSYGICCAEDHKLHTDSIRYNVANMTIAEWFNSEPVQNFRKSMLGVARLTECVRCYREEDLGIISRRHRSNQKSVIFTKSAFKESFDQSPHREHFSSTGLTVTHPVDIHIDLGNYCNLACKMCMPQASSVIANQLVKWGDQSALQYIGTDWTKNQTVWESVLSQLTDIPNLRNVHFMGGETLISSRFEDFVDHMIAHKKFDLSFSFVTNGTTFNESLLTKLKKFQRVGIELSIETLTEHNSYVRQGTNTAQVLKNIDRYLEHCNNNNITLTVRPAISALTIGYYHTLLEFCMEKNLLVKGLEVYYPAHMAVSVLPYSVRQQYLNNYKTLFDKFDFGKINNTIEFNDSNPYKVPLVVKNQIEQCMGLLCLDQDNTHHLKELVDHCRRWDRIYQFDALKLYPELQEIFLEHGY